MTNMNSDINKITNMDYLSDISKGNLAFIQEMIDIFVLENPKELESLNIAIRDRNFDAIRQAAHLLQSSIPFVGLDRIIGKETSEIEQLASDRSIIVKDEIPSAGNTSLLKIGALFYKVKESCENACLELSQTGYLQQSR